MCSLPLSLLETVPKKNETVQKNASNKNYTILFQIALDSGNITYSWISQFDKASSLQGKKDVDFYHGLSFAEPRSSNWQQGEGGEGGEEGGEGGEGGGGGGGEKHSNSCQMSLGLV